MMTPSSIRTTVVIVVVFMCAGLIGVIHRNSERQYKTELLVRMHCVRNLMLAAVMYGNEHGKLPHDLHDLAGFDFYNTPSGKKFFEEAAGKIEVVAPGLDASSRTQDVIFLRERVPDRNGLVVVGYADGHAEAVPFRRVASVLKDSPQR